ncbi:MAG: putative toxin-antitoxin system toxin component, PIN family [Acidimicrobiia bacterium]
MRAVLDPNVLISALLSRNGTPARVLRSWLDGAFELIVSDRLLAELERALSYPKLRSRVEPSEAIELVELLRRGARMRDDPDDPSSVRSPDPEDDYLIAVAESAQAVLVSGDRDLLGLAGQVPVFSPAGFLDDLDRQA